MTTETMVVLVPCRNEAQSVGRTLAEVLDVAPSLDLAVEVELIDDGSTDGTAEVMDELAAPHSNVRVVRNPKNLGVGRTVLDRYAALPADYWCTVCPGDGELVFSSIRNHLAVRADYDLILGYVQNSVIRPLSRRVASRAFTTVVNSLYGYPFRYLNGMKLYRIGVFKGIDVTSTGHAFNAELIAKAQLQRPGLRIGEVPYVARGRATGVSKAFRPQSIGRAVLDVAQGFASVRSYRSRAIAGNAYPEGDD